MRSGSSGWPSSRTKTYRCPPRGRRPAAVRRPGARGAGGGRQRCRRRARSSAGTGGSWVRPPVPASRRAPAWTGPTGGRRRGRRRTSGGLPPRRVASRWRRRGATWPPVDPCRRRPGIGGPARPSRPHLRRRRPGRHDGVAGVALDELPTQRVLQRPPQHPVRVEDGRGKRQGPATISPRLVEQRPVPGAEVGRSQVCRPSSPRWGITWWATIRSYDTDVVGRRVGSLAASQSVRKAATVGPGSTGSSLAWLAASSASTRNRRSAAVASGWSGTRPARPGAGHHRASSPRPRRPSRRSAASPSSQSSERRSAARTGDATALRESWLARDPPKRPPNGSGEETRRGRNPT